ncbi:hypothetical protein KAT08_03955 [Candidatus Babeliales bacterium]|nr:hypothetical protein [Candidatus Babeliales bacterium]
MKKSILKITKFILAITFLFNLNLFSSKDPSSTTKKHNPSLKNPFFYVPQFHQDFEEVSGAQLKQFSVGKNYVWGINSEGEIFKSNNITDKKTKTFFSKIEGPKLKQISVGYDDSVWGISEKGEIYRYNNKKWKKIRGNLKQISVGNKNYIFGIDQNELLYKWDPKWWKRNKWVRFKLPNLVKLKHVAVENNGELYVIGKYQEHAPAWVKHYKQLWQWNQTEKNWNEITCNINLKQISVGDKNNIVAISTSNTAYIYNPETKIFEKIGDGIRHISINQDKEIFLNIMPTYEEKEDIKIGNTQAYKYTKTIEIALSDKKESVKTQIQEIKNQIKTIQNYGKQANKIFEKSTLKKGAVLSSKKDIEELVDKANKTLISLNLLNKKIEKATGLKEINNIKEESLNLLNETKKIAVDAKSELDAMKILEKPLYDKYKQTLKIMNDSVEKIQTYQKQAKDEYIKKGKPEEFSSSILKISQLAEKSKNKLNSIDKLYKIAIITPGGLKLFDSVIKQAKLTIKENMDNAKSELDKFKKELPEKEVLYISPKKLLNKLFTENELTYKEAKSILKYFAKEIEKPFKEPSPKIKEKKATIYAFLGEIGKSIIEFKTGKTSDQLKTDLLNKKIISSLKLLHINIQNFKKFLDEELSKRKISELGTMKALKEPLYQKKILEVKDIVDLAYHLESETAKQCERYSTISAETKMRFIQEKLEKVYETLKILKENEKISPKLKTGYLSSALRLCNNIIQKDLPEFTKFQDESLSKRFKKAIKILENSIKKLKSYEEQEEIKQQIQETKSQLILFKKNFKEDDPETFTKKVIAPITNLINKIKSKLHEIKKQKMPSLITKLEVLKENESLTYKELEKLVDYLKTEANIQYSKIKKEKKLQASLIKANIETKIKIIQTTLQNIGKLKKEKINEALKKATEECKKLLNFVKDFEKYK